MKTKIVLTAMVAVFMALAFLPGALAQEEQVAVAQEEQVAVPPEPEAIIADLIAALPEELQPWATQLTGMLKKFGIWSAVMSVVTMFIGMIPSGLWAMIAPVWTVLFDIILGAMGLIFPLWAGLNDIDLTHYLFSVNLLLDH